MKFLRKRKVCKIITVFLLLVSIQSAFPPTIVLALTSGPHMPEYTSFGSTTGQDLVNLATGDFAMNLPILDVPGPDGNFSVPLTYNAGIGLDQQASWVGLGWNVNVGSITRNINGFPDDANGDFQSVTVQDLVGLQGVNVKLLGIGNFGYNTQVGEYGSGTLINIINWGWGNGGGTYVGLLGVNVGDHKVRFNSEQAAKGFITVATIVVSAGLGAAAGAGASAGTTAATTTATTTAATTTATTSSTAPSFLASVGKEAAKEAAFAAANDGFASYSRGSLTPNAPSTGYWQYSKKEKKNWALKVVSGFTQHYSEYKLWLDKSRAEKMYGTLYLGNAETVPSNESPNDNTYYKTKIGTGSIVAMQQFKKSTENLNEGSASDIDYQPGAPGVSFAQTNSPAILANDAFTVRASGISGNITPYRLDIGAVSMPREMTASHIRFAPLKYLTNDASNKVPFIYEGRPSNNYFHHMGGQTSVSPSAFNFGLSVGIGSDVVYNLNDVIFDTQRVRSDVSLSKKVAQGEHIDWLTNIEIKNNVTYASKYLDFLPGGTNSARSLFRTNGTPISLTTSTNNFASLAIPINAADISKLQGATVNLSINFYNSLSDMQNGVTAVFKDFNQLAVTSINTTNNTFAMNYPELSVYNGKYANISILITASPTIPSGIASQDGIGGFSITAADGTMYHFALPIYDYELYSEVHEIANPTTKRAIVKRDRAFANTWLLTAITGSDYIDRNGNGLADKDDWGFWVKFNYGKAPQDYQWRTPYTNFLKEMNGTHESYATGKKQLIYLNSIETRSHVALFLKSQRDDGKSADNPKVKPYKLDEIALVARSAYDKLVSDYAMLPLSDQITNLCLSSFFSSTPAARSFLNEQAGKRIVLNQDYSLASNTSNSSSGKLTLKSITIKGKNDKTAFPDYKFEYANNPAYSVDKWDGWGMYSSSATNTNSSKLTNQVNADSEASAWCLSKIVSPMGNEITVNYERDSYSTIGGKKIGQALIQFDNPNTTLVSPQDFPVKKLTLVHGGQISVGDHVGISGNVTYKCYGSTTTNTKYFNVDNLVVTAVTANTITVDQPYLEFPECPPYNSITLNAFNGSVSKYQVVKKGDGHRVSSIVTKDFMGTESKIRYIYSMEDNQTTSGAVFQEAEYAKAYNTSIPAPGAPSSPTIYGRVSVLTGKLTNDNDFVTKDVYEFEVPNNDMYVLTKNPIKLNEQTDNIWQTVYQNTIVDRTSKVGNLKSIKEYGIDGTLHKSVTLSYTENLMNDGVANNQGVYSSGTMMFDLLKNVVFLGHLLKVNRTTRISYPSILESVVTTTDGETTERKNLSWDFLTGQVDASLLKSSTGINIKTVTKPAYKFYQGMGSKADNASNANMLTQEAENYVYRADDSGNAIGLIEGSFQEWKKTWTNYRILAGGVYADGEETQSVSNPVWRIAGGYVFRGDYSRKQADGSARFSQSEKYVPGQANPLWMYTGELTRFDHFGMPLESKSMRNIYESSKMGYNDQYVIAAASNAKFTEIAFSSAEDEIPLTGFFGGEVAVKSSGGTATVVKGGSTHTGNCALSLSSTGGTGFVFKPTGLATKRNYRINVWCNSTNGRAYYKLNGGAEVLSTAPTKQGKAGWYLAELTVPVGVTFTSLEVGVKAASGTVLFDDFRFQPADAKMTCYVYPPLDYIYPAGVPNSHFVLDNNNLYVRYETSEDGLSSSVYAETISFGGGEKLVSKQESDYRRFHTN